MPSAFLPSPLPHHRLPPAPPYHHYHAPSLCTAPAHDAAPAPPSSPVLPACLRNTTILHNLPSHPSHLPTSPAHPLDNDAYLLALSIQSDGTVWSRARFARTKPFLVEAALTTRRYRGLHGTPGASGWNAPLKPKPTAARGAFIWGRARKRRAFAYGIRALPLAVDLASLVSKGYTAMGAVLTDSPELATERATEIVGVARWGNVLVVAGVGRAANGRVTGGFVTELDEEYKVRKRLAKFDVPAGCVVTDFIVAEKVCVVVMVKTEQRGSGILGALFGKKTEGGSPVVDVDFGSLLVVVSRNDDELRTCRIPALILSQVVSVRTNDNTLVVRALVKSGQPEDEELRLSTLADLKSGRYWDSNKKSRMVVRDIVMRASQSGELDPTFEGELKVPKDVSLLSAARPAQTDKFRQADCVYTAFDHSCSRQGLVACRSSKEGEDTFSMWVLDEPGALISAPLFSGDYKYVSAIVTRPNRDARVMFFEIDSLQNGPAQVVHLDSDVYGNIGCSVGGVWEAEAVNWSEEKEKPSKSAYEIFDSRNWNDIESGFSSLGLGQ